MGENIFVEEKQKEKSGSDTLNKYDFQYNWALSKIINKHSEDYDYIVFAELHEDIVISSSSELDEAEFEFCQVKGKSKGKATKSWLIKPIKGGSRLGKLIKNSINKKYSEKISSILFVTNAEYDLKLDDENNKSSDFDLIPLNKLNEDERNEVLSAVSKEIGVNQTDIPSCISFETSLLKLDTQEYAVVGMINEVLEKINPGGFYNCYYIYTALFDDLKRKGKNKVDYFDWDDVVKNKSTTRKQVESIFNSYCSVKKWTDDWHIFAKELSDSGYGALDILRIKSCIEEYEIKILAGRSLEYSEFSDLVENAYKTIGAKVKLKELIVAVKDAAGEKGIELFSDDHAMIAGLVYELARIIK